VFGDSTLVINQVNKDWDCTSKRMDAYCTHIKKLENKFYGLEFITWFRLIMRQLISCRS
jgi:hypothetical protein